MQQSLNDFIGFARQKGMDHQTIRVLLLSAGWKEKDIASALATETLGISVPSPIETNARDTFFYVLLITSLITTIVSSTSLLVDLLNHLLPDAASRSLDVYTLTDFSSIRFALASLIVAAPLYMWVSSRVCTDVMTVPEKLRSPVRRWLLHFLLFLGASVFIGDLITFLFYVLNGELSTRFMCKVLGIALIVAAPCAYYVRSLRADSTLMCMNKVHQMYQVSFGSILVALALWGFMVAGGPIQGRIDRFDAERSANLTSLRDAVLDDVYGSDRWTPGIRSSLPKNLPTSLDSLSNRVQTPRIDPETGVPYEYRVSTPSSFVLCASFGGEKIGAIGTFASFDQHRAGRQCYSIDALDPSNFSTSLLNNDD